MNEINEGNDNLTAADNIGNDDALQSAEISVLQSEETEPRMALSW